MSAASRRLASSLSAGSVPAASRLLACVLSGQELFDARWGPSFRFNSVSSCQPHAPPCVFEGVTDVLAKSHCCAPLKQAFPPGVSGLKAIGAPSVSEIKAVIDFGTAHQLLILRSIGFVVVLLVLWYFMARVDKAFDKVNDKLTNLTSSIDKLEGFL